MMKTKRKLVQLKGSWVPASSRIVEKEEGGASSRKG